MAGVGQELFGERGLHGEVEPVRVDGVQNGSVVGA
jgi:hypothetical protein